MTDHLEDLIAAEALRQGFKANADAIRAAAIDLAGGLMTSDRLIHMPGRGSISPADYIRDLLDRMPNAFARLADKRKAETTMGSLTEQMRQEVAASRRQQPLPSDWLAIRSKAAGITAQHMAERERNWK